MKINNLTWSPLGATCSHEKIVSVSKKRAQKPPASTECMKVVFLAVITTHDPYN